MEVNMATPKMKALEIDLVKALEKEEDIPIYLRGKIKDRILATTKK